MNGRPFLKRDIERWLSLGNQTPLQTNKVNPTAGSKKGTFLIDGTSGDCYTANLLDGKLALALPKLIRPIESETSKLKIRPYLTLANGTETVKITLYHLSQKVINDDEVLEYQNKIRQALKKTEPSVEWLLGGVKNVHGLEIAFFEVITMRFGTGVYNLSFFMSLDQRVLAGNFMCMERILKVWRPAFYQILESIEVKDAYKTLHL